MKRCIFSVITILLLCNMAQAQKTVIKLNPLSLIFATGNVAVERTILDRASLQLGVGIGAFRLGSGDTKATYTGFSTVPEIRVYLTSKPAPAGFFLGPFGVYRSFTAKQNVDNVDGNYEAKQNVRLLGGGLNIGYQIVTLSGFSIDFFAGPCYNTVRTKVVEGNEEDISVAPGLSGFGLRTGIAVGWAF